MSTIKTIYNGGFIPDLGIRFEPGHQQHGWLFFVHPDGQWVTLADLKQYAAELSPVPVDIEARDLWRRVNSLEEINESLRKALSLSNSMYLELSNKANELCNTIEANKEKEHENGSPT